MRKHICLPHFLFSCNDSKIFFPFITCCTVAEMLLAFCKSCIIIPPLFILAILTSFSLWCHLFLFSNSHFYFKAFFNSLTNATMTKISHVNYMYIQPICKFKLPNKFNFWWRNKKVPVISVFRLLQLIWLHRMYFSFLPIYISTLKNFLTF